MVVYDLVCDSGHEFEGWFKGLEEFQQQQSNGLLTCPFCESESVTKKLAAPKVGRKSNAGSQSQSVATGNGSAGAYTQLQDMLGQVHEFIDTNFEDVGNRFADEAIKIHRGQRDATNIRGTASGDELKVMQKEGVTVVPLPPKPVDKKKLN